MRSATRTLVGFVLLALHGASPGGPDLAAQTCDWEWAGENPASLGIGRLVCIGGACEINLPGRDGSRMHRFSTEPRVTELQKPASEVLREGDAIVAVDGVPITTLEGGRRLARVEVGVPVALTIRRRNRLHEVRLVPVAGCPIGALSVRRRAGPEE